MLKFFSNWVNTIMNNNSLLTPFDSSEIGDGNTGVFRMGGKGSGRIRKVDQKKVVPDSVDSEDTKKGAELSSESSDIKRQSEMSSSEDSLKQKEKDNVSGQDSSSVTSEGVKDVVITRAKPPKRKSPSFKNSLSSFDFKKDVDD